jgi:niacin transporter
MKESELRQIPLTALLAVAGVILPQFFHLFGLGPVFLPMFLPVMLGALLLRWRFAVALAIITPLVSFVITGMPPIAPPILPVMLAELILISSILSLLHVHARKNKWLALLVSVLTDRLLLFAIVFFLAPVFGLPKIFTSFSLVLSGIPGIILQFTVLPTTLTLIEKKFPQYVQRESV